MSPGEPGEPGEHGEHESSTENSLLGTASWESNPHSWNGPTKTQKLALTLESELEAKT